MPTDAQRLIGTWEKITHSACSRAYPDTLRFDPEGEYTGRQRAPGMFAIWDRGTYRLAGPGSISMSTASDVIRTYGYSLQGEILTFDDSAACRFRYRRQCSGR